MQTPALPRSRRRGLATGLVLSVALLGPAARAAEDATPPGADPIAEQVFPPELVMRHQKAIRLSEAQKNALIAEVKRVQTSLVDIQWEMQRALEPLVEQLGKERPDEPLALAQLDKVLAAEREIKRAHITLAVRLKGLLTSEQQRQLRELRAASPAAPAARPAAPR
jgi:Spy/CpxP family protein refolding chaperone